jgi:signal transduction histidine kinase
LVVAMVTMALGWIVARATKPTPRHEDVLGAVMAATILRRSRKETMGHLVEAAVRALGADGATIHLVEPRADRLELAYANGLDNFEQFARIPSHDPLVQTVLAHKDELVMVEVDNPSLRWASLAHGKAKALSAMRLGGPRGSRLQHLLVFGWASKARARAATPRLIDVGRYARQVLSGLDETEARARDIQTLTSAVQAQEVLTRTMAHDVLNKVTASLGALELAGDEPEVRRAKSQIALVGEMLEDLRDPDRPIKPRPVPVEELVELSAGLMSVYQEDQPVDFRLDIAPALPDVLGERVEILRVLDNLLTNAVRHNSDRLPLRVWLRVRREGDGVLFEIGDDGHGIQPGAAGRLFEYGMTTDATGRAKAHGMGLWSCRRIVEAHRGRIWAEGAPDEGARFYFTLPATD